MDLNVVVLHGRLATAPEVRELESGVRMIRYLVTTRAEEPRRRVDVLPVTLWEPSADLAARPGEVGDRVWIAGSVQRRFWASPDGRKSGIEIVAHAVQTPAENCESLGAGSADFLISEEG